MKILVVCQYYYPEPFRISDICETLVDKGHDVTVLTGIPNYPEGKIFDDYKQGKKREEKLKGVKVIRSFEFARGNSKVGMFVNYSSFAISASIKAFFMKEKFDVVLVNQLSPVMMGIPAIVYKRKHSTKILLYCLDLWPASLAAGGVEENSIIYNVFLKVSKWIYNSADMILVTSTMFREYFRNTLGINDENIDYLPQYAEDLFTRSKYTPKKSGKLNLVFAGNIGDMQSVETIIKAAKELYNYPDIIFHIVGDGSKLTECKELSNNIGLNNVIFYGRKPVSEMPDFYEMADAMLVTLKNNKILSYTLPGKVQSYMAASKPIIGAINGETKHVIRKSKCGFCCDAEDYRELARLVLKFYKSDEKQQMGLNAQKFYYENYSKNRFIAKLERELVNLGGKM